jgi:hypothetical protein
MCSDVLIFYCKWCAPLDTLDPVLYYTGIAVYTIDTCSWEMVNYFACQENVHSTCIGKCCLVTMMPSNIYIIVIAGEESAHTISNSNSDPRALEPFRYEVQRLL